MKTLISLIILFSASNAFSKTITCQDSNLVKTFQFSLENNEKEYARVDQDVFTKVVINDLNKYSEVDDFAVITDLKTRKSMTYSLICKDS